MLLTLTQSREINRMSRLNLFLNHHSVVYTTYMPFAEERQVFADNLKSLQEKAINKERPATGITDEKTMCKALTARLIGAAANETSAFARKYKLPELQAAMSISESDVVKMKDGDIYVFANQFVLAVVKYIDDPDFIPYGVTQATLDLIVGTAKTFNNMIGKAKETNSHSTVGNGEINEYLVLLKGSIGQFDLLIGKFAESDPAFVKGYFINKKLEKTGVRHSGMTGKIEDAKGNAVAGAVVKLRGSKYSATTDLQGNYSIIQMVPKEYVVDVIARDYEDMIFLHKVVKSRIAEVDVKMNLAEVAMKPMVAGQDFMLKTA